jgi:hypothetical protein
MKRKKGLPWQPLSLSMRSLDYCLGGGGFEVVVVCGSAALGGGGAGVAARGGAEVIGSVL